MGIILLIISINLKRLFGKLGWVYNSIRILYIGYKKGGFKNAYNDWSDWNEVLAIINDKYGNVLLQWSLNDACIKQDKLSEAHLFGNPKETISSAIGKNLVKDKLSNFGKIINNILNFLDKNHSIKSIDNNV